MNNTGYSFKIFILNSTVIATICIAVILFSLQRAPHIIATSTIDASDHTTSLAILDPFRIAFSRPVNRRTLQLEFEPRIEGEISFEKPVLGRHLYTQVVFKPLYAWQPGISYRVRVKGIQNVLNRYVSKEATLSIPIETLPRIVAVEFGNANNRVNIDPEILVRLDKPNTFVEMYFESQPAISWNGIVNETKDIYTVTPEVSLDYNSSYTLRIYGSYVIKDDSNAISYQGPKILMYDTTFQTPRMIVAHAFTPTGSSIGLKTPIIIESSTQFDAELLSEKSIIHIEPETEGELQWTHDSTTLQFIPKDPWKEDTQYSVTLDEDYCVTINETNSLGQCIFSFHTVSPIKVASLFPENNMQGIDVKTPISITFDQDIDPTSFEKRIKITPPLVGAFSLEGNTITLLPLQPLAFSTTYKVIITRGIKSLKGTQLNETVETSFKTEPSTKQLSIKMDFQDRPLSCEAAVLKMGLSHFSIAVTEDDIMNIIGYDNRESRGDTWGDPHKGYVGNIDGKQNTSGYGVYWEPVARAAKNWKPNSFYFVNWTLQQVLEEIEKGHPVLMWGVYPGGKPDSWVTKEGKTIKAWKGEHTRVIAGFIGTTDNPIQIIVLDPYDGKQYWKPDRLIENWSGFDMSGVVVK